MIRRVGLIGLKVEKLDELGEEEKSRMDLVKRRRVGLIGLKGEK